MNHVGRKVTTKDYPRVSLRIPEELYEFLSKSAASKFTSVNSEITLRLLKSMKEERNGKRD
jgi:hypothetical protein